MNMRGVIKANSLYIFLSLVRDEPVSVYISFSCKVYVRVIVLLRGFLYLCVFFNSGPARMVRPF